MGYKHGGVDIVSIYHGNRVRVPSTFGSGSYRVAMIRSDASSAKGTSGHTGGVTECNTKEGALTIEIMNGAKDSMQRVCSSGGSRLSEGQGAYDEEAPEIEYCEPVVVKDGERSRAKVVYVLPEQTPPAVKIVLGQRPGWVEWDAELHTEDEWNFRWKSGRFKPSEYRDVRRDQRLNHFPRSGLITRKDLLLRVLRKMKAVHGTVYAFHPDSYMLPSEYTKFIEEFTRLQHIESHVTSDGEVTACTSHVRSIQRFQEGQATRGGSSGGTVSGSMARQHERGFARQKKDAGDGSAMWIVKPSDSSRGRGVYLLRELGELAYDQASIVQRYISHPLTVGGYKADLRLYAVVTSLHPMAIHLYRDGIVRFATSKYKGSPHHDVFGHLTNCSINKRSPFADKEKDVIGEGCKWTLRKLKHWVQTSGKDGPGRWSSLWTKIRSVVCLSVLPLAEVVPGGVSHGSCFELFGFDIMVNSTLNKLHLIEINCSPALGLEEASDRQVKLPLMADLLDLVDVDSACREEEEARVSRTSRAQSLPGYSRPLASASEVRKGRVCSGVSSRTDGREYRSRERGCTARANDDSNDNDKGKRICNEDVRGHSTCSGRRSAADDNARNGHDEDLMRADCGLDGGGSDEGSEGAGFESIFPFNDDSRDCALRLSENARAGSSNAVKVQACIRGVIAEIKAHEKRCTVELQGQPRLRGMRGWCPVQEPGEADSGRQAGKVSDPCLPRTSYKSLDCSAGGDGNKMKGDSTRPSSPARSRSPSGTCAANPCESYHGAIRGDCLHPAESPVNAFKGESCGQSGIRRTVAGILGSPSNGEAPVYGGSGDQGLGGDGAAIRDASLLPGACSNILVATVTREIGEPEPPTIGGNRDAENRTDVGHERIASRTTACGSIDGSGVDDTAGGNSRDGIEVDKGRGEHVHGNCEAPSLAESHGYSADGLNCEDGATNLRPFRVSASCLDDGGVPPPPASRGCFSDVGRAHLAVVPSPPRVRAPGVTTCPHLGSHVREKRSKTTAVANQARGGIAVSTATGVPNEVPTTRNTREAKLWGLRNSPDVGGQGGNFVDAMRDDTPDPPHRPRACSLLCAKELQRQDTLSHHRQASGIELQESRRRDPRQREYLGNKQGHKNRWRRRDHIASRRLSSFALTSADRMELCRQECTTNLSPRSTSQRTYPGGTLCYDQHERRNDRTCSGDQQLEQPVYDSHLPEKPRQCYPGTRLDAPRKRNVAISRQVETIKVKVSTNVQPARRLVPVDSIVTE